MPLIDEHPGDSYGQDLAFSLARHLDKLLVVQDLDF
jgi:hypothetical protein